MRPLLIAAAPPTRRESLRVQFQQALDASPPISSKSVFAKESGQFYGFNTLCSRPLVHHRADRWFVVARLAPKRRVGGKWCMVTNVVGEAWGEVVRGLSLFEGATSIDR